MFNPYPPDAPLTYAGPELADAADGRQYARVKKLAGIRSSDASATWRGVLLGKLKQRQDRLLSAMSDAGLPEHVVERTANCGKHAFVFRNNDTGRLRIRHYTCHNRFCLMCQRAYLRQVRLTALALLPAPRYRLSFLTLTQRAHHGVEISEAIHNILNRFTSMRRTVAWKLRVPGGIYLIDITRAKQGWWHVHLHVVVDSAFWELDVLDRICTNNTKNPLRFNIKRVDGARRKSLNIYVAKYMSKPFDDSLYDNPEALAAFIRATRNRRLIQAFGSWTPNNLTHKASHKIRQTTDGDQWTYAGELHWIIEDAERGSTRAANILRQLGFGAIHLRIGAVSDPEWFSRARAPPPERALQLWQKYA